MASDSEQPKEQRRPARRTTRLSLGGSRRRLSFELRLRLWLIAFLCPIVLLIAIVLYQEKASVLAITAAVASIFLAALIVASAFTDQIVRPLQTLSNVIAALREDDFSFRARGGRRGDSLGDLAIEINALAATLQRQRSSALEALTLVERVMRTMESPVLAFDARSRLRLYNTASERAFHLKTRSFDDPIGRSAVELNVAALLEVVDEGLFPPVSIGVAAPAGAPRYVVRRTTFRLNGEPHILLVLADITSALREEERQAWQRLIRVLGHEINNSLTPIKSIAGTLRSRLPEADASGDAQRIAPERLNDLERGLAVIEDRAASLNRFLEAYRRLSTLPSPKLQPVALAPLLERVAQLEIRLAVRIVAGPPASVFADPDQLQQVLINLIQNAADAALEAAAASADQASPAVSIGWELVPSTAAIHVIDNGLGLLNPDNLFVPFYTTKPDGSGIGLALAKQILAAHQATLTLNNRAESRGCVAEIHLPLASSQVGATGG